LSSVSSVDVSVLGLASAIVDDPQFSKCDLHRQNQFVTACLLKNETCERHNINIKI